MPSVKDFKKTHKTDKHPESHTPEASEAAGPEKAKRRPGREPKSQEAEAVAHPETHHADTPETEQRVSHDSEIHSDDPTPIELESEEHEAKKKIEISFFGSEILRAKLPKPFEVAEAVATDWVNDGKFEGLPLGHPLAQVMASTGLRKAKELEKKIVESGVLEKVAMQALTAGLKAQTEINNIREQVKAKLGKK